MPEKKLLARLSAYLDLGAKRRRKKAEELEKIISKLKKMEKTMIASCRTVGKKSKERNMLEKRYRIVHAQRKKGQKALKKIK